jgi:pyridoxamine 5'-phosphate oxidase family protein
MSAFTPAEIEYLQSQPLMRFASASLSGRPDVAPVIFELDGDDIVTAGFNIASTVRYRNVKVNPRATLVIDDLASMDPWTPRGVKITGSCMVEQHNGSERFRISPEVIISWGVNDTTPGIPKMERRSVA